MGWWLDDSCWIRVIDDVTETFPIGTLRNRCTPINPILRAHPRNIISIFPPLSIESELRYLLSFNSFLYLKCCFTLLKQ